MKSTLLSFFAMRRFCGLALLLLLGSTAFPAFAHGDEDHSAPAAKGAGVAVTTPAVNTGIPKRLPDGSVWVPKPVQHQLGIRTELSLIKPQAVAVELNGRVMADPNAGGRVQATQAGRIEPGPTGLPVLGQKVKKGQVLAYLVPAVSSLERSNQEAALADLDAQQAMATQKTARYAQLQGVVPEKDIEAARLERDALSARGAAVLRGLTTTQALIAPVSGVVAASSVVIGQVVDAKDVLFEFVDPARLVVEALAYDAALTSGLGKASAAVPGGTLELVFLGGGRQLREQALILMFRVTKPDAPLAIGQALKVTALTDQTINGVALPLSAVNRNATGESFVWLHKDAEQFVQQVVQTRPLDARSVVVTSGLKDKDRVVSQGASLLAQIR